MSEETYDAAAFARAHAGENEPDLTPEQRSLLGRVLAKRIEQGIALRLIERAAVRALPELDEARVRRLARDETVRAFAAERLAQVRRAGAAVVAISAAANACAVCASRAGTYALDEHLPPLPHPDCTREGGCRCLYIEASSSGGASGEGS